MIVINVLGIGASADGAPATLLRQQLVELGLADPITPPKVVLPRPAMETKFRLLAPSVMARLAVPAMSAGVVAVTRKVREWLGLRAIWTATMAFRHIATTADVPPKLVTHALRIAGLRSQVEAVLAIATAS
jgi:hypothetical protein